jgi:hypothetical protein
VRGQKTAIVIRRMIVTVLQPSHSVSLIPPLATLSAAVKIRPGVQGQLKHGVVRRTMAVVERKDPVFSFRKFGQRCQGGSVLLLAWAKSDLFGQFMKTQSDASA